MTTDLTYPFKADCKLAMLLPELGSIQQEDLIMVLARIEGEQGEKQNADYWLNFDALVNDRAEEWPRRIDEGYTKPTLHEKPTKEDAKSGLALCFAPRLRPHALDLAAARLVTSAYDQLGKHERSAAAGPDPNKLSVTVDYPAMIDMAIESAKVRDAIEHLEDVLPGQTQARRREVLVLYWRGLSQQDIAAQLGIPVHTVNNECHKARKAVLEYIRAKDRKRLAEHAATHAGKNVGRPRLGSEVTAVSARVFNRECHPRDQELCIEDLRWNEDGWLTGKVTMPTDQPMFFGFVQATASPDVSLTSGAFQLRQEVNAAPDVRTLRAFLGTLPAHHFAKGPLPLPPGALSIVLAHV